MSRNVRGFSTAITEYLSLCLWTFFAWLLLLPGFSNPVKAAESSRIVLLAFTSEGCPACHVLEPLISGLEQKNYPIRRVSPNDRSGSELYDQYEISTMPSFVLLTDGKEASRFISKGEDIQFVQERLLGMFRDASNSLAPMVQTPKQQEVRSSLETPVSAGTTASNNRGPAGKILPGTEKVLASTVRLRISGSTGETDSGTGTIIHTNSSGNSSEGLILTCGHLFRESEGKSPVQVDLYQPETGKMTTVTGECVFYDDDLDIGFVGIPLPFSIEPVRLAPQNYMPKAGDTLFSVGCSSGNHPSVWQHQIRSTDQKFYQPRDPRSANSNFYFIEVTNAPLPGRSGGGLFTQTADGQPFLVGVCNAGDPQTDEGYFLPFSVVYDQLSANSNLAFVYNEMISNQMNSSERENIQPVSFDTDRNADSSQKTIRQPNYEKSEVKADPEIDAKLQELRKLLDQGAEVFCIINWAKDNSGRERESEMMKLKRNNLQ